MISIILVSLERQSSFILCLDDNNLKENQNIGKK